MMTDGLQHAFGDQMPADSVTMTSSCQDDL